MAADQYFQSNRWQVVLTAVLIFVSFAGQAQNSRLAKADRYFEEYAYSRAIPLYATALEKGVELEEAMHAQLRLGDCYLMIRDYGSAEKWYREAFNGDQGVPENAGSAYLLQYARVLQINSKCDEAREWFVAFHEREPDDARGLAGIRSCSGEMEESAGHYEIAMHPASSSFHEIGPSHYQGDLLFCSSRPKERSKNSEKYKDAWTGEAYFDLFRAIEKDDSTAVLALPEPLNTQYHEGPAAWDEEDMTLYLTRTFELPKGQVSRHSKVLGLTLFEASFNGEQWDEPKRVDIPELNGSAVHPAPDPNGDRLFFASDREGGFGGYDLYVTTRMRGAWSEPENLGPLVNTEGDDLFPHLDEEGTLFWASDGRVSLGGMDIYFADLDELSDIHHPGAPLNSAHDDFGIIWTDSIGEGIMVSNRPGGAGGDDLWYVRRVDLFPLLATVLDADSLPVSGVEVRIVNANGEVSEGVTLEDGTFRAQFEAGKNYQIAARQDDYVGASLDYFVESRQKAEENPPVLVLASENAVGISGKVVRETTGETLSDAEVKLTKLEDGSVTNVPVGDDGRFGAWVDPDSEYELELSKKDYISEPILINTAAADDKSVETLVEATELAEDVVIELDDIYYDYGKYDLRPDAIGGLTRLKNLLEQYPEMTIELSSHTDSRSSMQYNNELSQKRAEAARNFLIGFGVTPERITAKGYGETRLRNSCKDGIYCSEDQHQRNRRTEFKITSYHAQAESQEGWQVAGVVTEENWKTSKPSRNVAKTASTSVTPGRTWYTERTDGRPAWAGIAQGAENSNNWWSSGPAFAVQVGVDKVQNSSRFEFLDRLGEVRVEGSGLGFYRYVIGYVPGRVEAEELLVKVRQEGIRDAFIVTYDNGERQPGDGE